MTCTGHVACMGKTKNAYKILAGKFMGRRHLEDLSKDRRIILKFILKK
jgi:hypothetical protein